VMYDYTVNGSAAAPAGVVGARCPAGQGIAHYLLPLSMLCAMVGR
jgi:hypothetical protein